MGMRAAASAANRFGLGARPGELAQVGDDPRDWLRMQLRGGDVGTAFAGLPTSAAYLGQYYDLLRARRDARKAVPGVEAAPAAVPDPAQRRFRRQLAMEAVVRQRVAVRSAQGFAERIVRFWSNHFAISVDKRIAAAFAAPMEREAIRPHAFGRFADLLLAVERHPGMLLYLDNAQSIGEDSRLGQRSARRAGRRPDARKRGLNENLAREILELHTLGVDGGYAQADVGELARALTGWSVPGPREDIADGQASVFRAEAHEPGVRTILGKAYRDAGAAQAEAILRDLAVHPATARHLAFKLARHCVADVPPPALVARMARAYLDSDGALPALYAAMIDDDAAWGEDARKFKTPDDFLLSALRATGLDGDVDVRLALQLQAQLGQPLFQPRSPAGFGDIADDWGGPDALFKRVQAAQALAERAAVASPAALGADVLGDALGADAAMALRRAESAQQGVALLLASPVFQWRC
ncbi:MAG TPA: DUF1800 domain-containing protein [Thermomonas sp.]